MTTAETWRVVLKRGRVRDVRVTETQAGPEIYASCGSHTTRSLGSCPSAREAVMALACVAGWPVVEILAPGEITRAEALDGARRAAAAACIAWVGTEPQTREWDDAARACATSCLALPDTAGAAR